MGQKRINELENRIDELADHIDDRIDNMSDTLVEMWQRERERGIQLTAIWCIVITFLVARFVAAIVASSA